MIFIDFRLKCNFCFEVCINIFCILADMDVQQGIDGDRSINVFKKQEEPSSQFMIVKYEEKGREEKMQQVSLWTKPTLYAKKLVKYGPVIEIFSVFCSIFKKLLKGFFQQGFQSNGLQASLANGHFPWIGACIGGAVVFSFVKKIFFRKLSPQQRAEKMFELTISEVEEKQVKWVYNTKKKYYEKSRKDNIYYQNQLKQLQQCYKIILDTIHKREKREKS